ncbi:IS5 family transposase [Mucilaginibacter sp.]|uniref:IS5 family transposase n=1 Tax=Mucilaginibacter sp. TaxID=1882438 RepID=UPI0025FE4D6B|nr:IS5 family transposase [Mucilaginibacter sp.]
MLTPSKKYIPQLGLFTGLADQLNQKHPLYQLSHKIDWSVFENAFKIYYSETMGKPSKPIRLMVALLILKYVRNLSDENLIEQWSENIYYQYFSGEHHFRPAIPCVPTELVAFRQRIGEAGVELILKESIRVNEPPDNGAGTVVSVDTTVQEKNITYPTDDKLYKKIIKKCWKLADEEGIDLRQSYRRVVKKLGYQQRFKNTKTGARDARKANKKIKIIAGRLVRELARKLPLDRLGIYLPNLKLYQRVLSQKRDDKDKVYSLHELDVKCYAKGKEHKKFEFGSKASILVDQSTAIIMGAINFTETLHDSKTIPEALEQYERLTGKQAAQVFVDRGYKGLQQYKTSQIHVPKPDKNISRSKRKKHSKRAAIEPVIGHLKADYRLCRNFLKGILGDLMNVIMAAAAMNFKRVMNLWRTGENGSPKLIEILYSFVLRIILPQNLKTTF